MILDLHPYFFIKDSRVLITQNKTKMSEEGVFFFPPRTLTRTEGRLIYVRCHQTSQLVSIRLERINLKTLLKLL